MADNDINKSDDNRNTKLKGGVFLTSIAGISMLFGFGFTIAAAKKKDPGLFAKSLNGAVETAETGADLALRALGWGTLYSVTGVTAFTLLLWKLTGCNTMVELRGKLQAIVPRASHHHEPGRSEFGTVRELVEYVISEDERKASLGEDTKKR